MVDVVRICAMPISAPSRNGIENRLQNMTGASDSSRSSSIVTSTPVSLGLNRTFSIGSALGVPNELSTRRFLGIDRSLATSTDLINFRSRPLDVHANFSTRPTDNIRAGLDVSAGFGLGSISVSGGLGGSVSYNSDTRTANVDLGFVNPSFAVQQPYAFAKISPQFRLNVNPSIYYRVDPAGSAGPYTGVPSLFSINVNPTLPALLDIDTRRGQPGFNRSANGATINSSLPTSSDLSLRQNSSSLPGSYSGSISGTKRILSLDYDLATFSPVPLSGSAGFSTPVGGLSASATLLSARLGAALDLAYNANITANPELVLTLEGSRSVSRPNNTGLRFPVNNVRDVNGDGTIQGSLSLDYVLSGAINVRAIPTMTLNASGLSGSLSASLLGFSRTAGFGPLLNLGTSLPAASVSIANTSRSVRLSQLLGQPITQSFSIAASSLPNRAPNPADDYTSNSSTTGSLVIGGSVTGVVNAANDRDWFRVSLLAGTTYRFNLNGNTLGDPTLYLRNASGAQLAFNDDFQGNNSQITFTIQASGTYFLDAGAFGSGTGSYALSMSATATSSIRSLRSRQDHFLSDSAQKSGSFNESGKNRNKLLRRGLTDSGLTRAFDDAFPVQGETEVERQDGYSNRLPRHSVRLMAFKEDALISPHHSGMSKAPGQSRSHPARSIERSAFDSMALGDCEKLASQFVPHAGERLFGNSAPLLNASSFLANPHALVGS